MSKKENRAEIIINLLEHMKEPMDILNREIDKLLNEEIPTGSYIEETPEFQKVSNYYLALPTSSSIQDFIKEIEDLHKTIQQAHIGIH